MTAAGTTFRVLHVCTGNICRSPMAERLHRSLLEQAWPEQAHRFVVESAGTWGHSGSPMEPFALSTLSDLGIDGSDFRARELVAEHVAGADLVLTATREHRAGVLGLHPDAAERTFLLLEFARLLEGVPPADLPDVDPVARARALVRLADARRGAAPDPGRGDDVADPYSGPASSFAACADRIAAALSGPVSLLAAARAASSQA